MREHSVPHNPIGDRWNEPFLRISDAVMQVYAQSARARDGGIVSTHISWPRKTREMHSHHFNSTIWNDFDFREDDIVIATFGKAGTTWMQQIVGQLIFKGEENVPVSELSPWLDLRFPPKEVKLAALNAQRHRRFVKTHLPVDALVFNPHIKYVYIARDGRDILWSLYNHHAKANEKWYAAMNGPGLVGEPVPHVDLDVVPYFRRWLERDGYPFWSLWENVRSWWAVRDLPNVLLVHYANLKRDLSGEMQSGCALSRHRHSRCRLAETRGTLRLRLHEKARRKRRTAGWRDLGGWGGQLHLQGHERPLARPPHQGRCASL